MDNSERRVTISEAHCTANTLSLRAQRGNLELRKTAKTQITASFHSSQ